MCCKFIPSIVCFVEFFKALLRISYVAPVNNIFLSLITNIPTLRCKCIIKMKVILFAVFKSMKCPFFFLRWHFISGRGSYLVCNGSITILKKPFKLTSRTAIYPAKWPTEERDYQKINKDMTSFFCPGVKLK